MTAWTSFMKEFFENERKNYKSCAQSGTLKRAAKIYNFKKNLIKKSEKKSKKSKNDSFKMVNPMFKKGQFRKTMKVKNKNKK